MNTITRRAFLSSSAAVLAVGVSGCREVVADLDRLPSGRRIATMIPRSAKPVPVVFNFALSAQETIDTAPPARMARKLYDRGIGTISLDLPCHGEDCRPNEPKELDGWRWRLSQGEDLLSAFIDDCKVTIDKLAGTIDRSRMYASGTSRGAFAAFQLASAESRIKSIAALSPVVDLLVLTEFVGFSNPPSIQVEKIIDRKVWIAVRERDNRISGPAVIRFADKLARAGNSPMLRIVPGDHHTLDRESYIAAADWIAAA
jgi:dienelactone hydrolase